MKLLIIGASGLIGSTLLRTARELGYQVLGTRNKQEIEGLVPLDLSNTEDCRRLIGEFRPDAVVCCAAWPWVDGCENDPERALRENCTQPARLAQLSAEVGAAYVYISTSYVFDGEKGPYSEEDIPNPINVYGRSKLSGEQAVLDATGGRAIIARTMGVYGAEVQRKNFVYQVIDTLSQGRRMKVPADQYGNATHTGDFSAMILALLEKKASGIWNVAGPDPFLNRKDFALKIAREYELDASLFDFIKTVELGQPAQRPLQGGLLTEKVEACTGIRCEKWNFLGLS